MFNSLYIKNFRSLENFHVPKLGRVNLIVGNNNTGKSTVLEALRIYAGNATRTLLEKIADEHDEKTKLDETGSAGATEALPFEAFFTGRRYPTGDDDMIIIGQSESDPSALKIRHGFLVEAEETVNLNGEIVSRTVRRLIPKSRIEVDPEAVVSQALFIGKEDKTYRIRFDPFNYRIKTFSEISNALSCSYVPTRFITMDELALEWDKVVLTENEAVIKEAMAIISPEFLDLAFVKDEEVPASKRETRRIGKIRLSSSPSPVPLNSMGDGLLRVLQLILKTFPAKGGFLLIDEFENGLHFSVQEKVWGLLFDLAERMDIQIFASTHSWDCIESFAKVAVERKSIDGVLFRMGKSVRTSDKGKIIATVFDEDQLKNITQAAVEVR